jgi:putative addiction module killer protein
VVVVELVEYVAADGAIPFAEWLRGLDNRAFAKVTAALARLREGNHGDVKAVGEGVSERRIHHGPGYRVYFGRDGQKLVVLLGGGTKTRQNADIRAAQEAWAEYKRRKRQGE